MLDVAAARAAVVDPWQLVPPLVQVLPQWSMTLGPEVADVCALLGFAPDPEQELVLDATFAVASDGLPAARTGTVLASRQNLKSAVFEMICLGWLLVTCEPLALWSAHETKTARASLLHLQGVLEGHPLTRRRLVRITTALSDMRIVLRQHGVTQQLQFGARTTEAGRGMSAPKIVRDEDLETREEHLAATQAVTSTYPDAQTIAGSSGAKDYSEVLHRQLAAAREGAPGRYFHLEWGAGRDGSCVMPDCVHAKDAIGCRLDDPLLLRASNPAVGRIRESGRGLTWEALAEERRNLVPRLFARERLTWHDELRADLVLLPAFAAEQITAITDRGSSIVGEPRFALDVSPGRASSSIVVGGRTASGLVHLETTSSPGVPGRRYWSQPGTGWVAGWVRSRLDAEDTTTPTYERLRIVVLAGSEAMALVPALQKITGVDVDVVPEAEYPAACGSLADAVDGEQVVIVGDPPLVAAMQAARRRKSPERAAGWSRASSDVDISPLVAATLLHWRLADEPDYDPLDSVG